jgi:hypothetical protein
MAWSGFRLSRNAVRPSRKSPFAAQRLQLRSSMRPMRRVRSAASTPRIEREFTYNGDLVVKASGVTATRAIEASCGWISHLFWSSSAPIASPMRSPVPGLESRHAARGAGALGARRGPFDRHLCRTRLSSINFCPPNALAWPRSSSSTSTTACWAWKEAKRSGGKMRSDSDLRTWVFGAVDSVERPLLNAIGDVRLSGTNGPKLRYRPLPVSLLEPKKATERELR